MKNSNPSTTGFSEYYQSILGQRTRNWNYRDTAGYRAYFVDTIASAMKIRELPKDTATIEKELDALKNSQTENGSFKNFGNFPEFRGNSDSAQYFQTAFILIPFLKFRRFITKKYDDVIEKGFGHLSGVNDVQLMDKEALSVASYAFALNGDYNQAQKLLYEVEKDSINIDKHRKCFKLSVNHSNCDLKHTSYAAIAYLTMNKIKEAKPLVVYILYSYNLERHISNTYSYAVSTEAFAKFLIATMSNRATNLTFTLTNVADFNKVFQITNKNEKDPVLVDFPDYTLHPKITVRGVGFCSITNIIENLVTTKHTSSKFNLAVTPLPASLSNERIVRVCAAYQPPEDEVSLQTLFNVIYDVEMPSGYTFTEIVNMESKPEIKVKKCA